MTLVAKPDGSDAVANPTAQDIRFNVSLSLFQFKNKFGRTLGNYGHIVGLAGDYFGPKNPTSVICSGADDGEDEALFMESFNQMWQHDSTAIDTAISIVRDQLWVEEAQVVANRGVKPPYEALGALPESRYFSKELNVLNFIDLVIVNFDHFGECGKRSYKVGHTLAMRKARAASALLAGLGVQDLAARTVTVNTARAMMEEAYAMDAFAGHFLTDAFASGHFRTPRRALITTCLADTLLQVTTGRLADAGVASQWMHDEDNRNGLLVKNARGDVFRTYGDRSYHDDKNNASREILAEAVRTSVDEVYKASINQSDAFGALQLTPDMSQESQFALNNTCALFRRDPVTNVLQIRTPIDTVRPPKYFNASDPSATCTYRAFTLADCPNAVKDKVLFNFDISLSEVASKFGISLGVNVNALTFLPSSDAWVSQRALSEYDSTDDDLRFLLLVTIIPGGVALLCLCCIGIKCINRKRRDLLGNCLMAWCCCPCADGFTCCGYVKDTSSEPNKLRGAEVSMDSIVMVAK